MKKVKLVFIISIIIIIGIIGIAIYAFFNYIGPVSKDDTLIEITVKQGDTFYSLAETLKENNLIKSIDFYKFYVSMEKPKGLQAGKYYLSKSMDLTEIIKQLSSGSNYNKDTVKITIIEGKPIEEIANVVSNVTNNSKESLIKLWDSKDFLDKAKQKYWFITDDVSNKNLRHSLEGYFFPSTYELINKDVDGEYVAFKMLDQMEKVLNKHKEAIENSKYSVHEILTLSSIVEYEAILDEDRPKIAGVFYNRLKANDKLQSCATVGYVIGEWKLTYTNKDMAVDSPYNTYIYPGLPVGPVNAPSEKAIEAVLNPTSHDYYYFLADVCIDGYGPDNKTYYSKTYTEHVSKKNKYLTC